MTTDTTRAHCRDRSAVRRLPVQTGVFAGQKRTLWTELDDRASVCSCYWDDDATSRRPGVHAWPPDWRTRTGEEGI